MLTYIHINIYMLPTFTLYFFFTVLRENSLSLIRIRKAYIINTFDEQERNSFRGGVVNLLSTFCYRRMDTSFILNLDILNCYN